MPVPPLGAQHRVLIITREFPPAIGPHSIRIAKLAKYLRGLSWRPSVVTTPIDHAWAVDASLAADVANVETTRVARLLARGFHPRAGIDKRRDPELPSPDEWRTGLRGRLARLLLPDSSILWAIPAARMGARLATSVDVVLTSGPPFSTHLAGAWVHRARGTPWVAEYRDNWTTNPLYRRSRPIQWLLRRLEGRLLRSAAVVVVVSEAAGTEMLAAFPFLAGRIMVAPNGFDPDDMPRPGSRPAAFEIAYIGSLHRRRDPSALFKVLGRLASEREDLRRDLRLRLTGNIPRWVTDAATAAIGSNAVETDGIVPHRVALELASSAAVLLAITSESEAGPAGMTSKFVEYLGLRRPILLLAPDGPARRMLDDLEAGRAALLDDEPGIETAVLALYEEWAADRERLADPARLAALTRLGTAERMASALSSSLDQVSRSSAARRSASRARPADTDHR